RVPGARFRQGDVTRLPDPDGSYDAALSLLVIQFVPDRAAAIRELRRVTRPGGLVAAAMWDFVGGFVMQRVFMDTAASLMPAEADAFRARYLADSMGSPGRIAALFAAEGLLDVTDRDITIRQDLLCFADLWEPWELGQGVAGAFVVTLDEARRTTLREATRRAYLAGTPDGPRSFVATARMAMARVPA
ncbi:MAG TPA: methyltransferase domain-containing protein, partial [Acetobacteraceae bacterium]|nr:methyltransferase domain-containing protein [Acetobacteraceae bacterium]